MAVEKSNSIKLNEAERLKVKKIIEKHLEFKPFYMKDILGHLLLSEGKYVRADLMILSAMFGKYDSDRITELAAVVELLHLATLVHDDIIDEEKMRRGRESIQAKFGKDVAVFTGDYLFTRCFSILSDKYLKHMKELSRGIEKICLGEIYQNKNRYHSDISVRTYLKIISGKTAALFAMAMYAGAKEADVTENKARKLGRIGYNIGMAFQIIDDCLDYSGDEELLKKGIRKDLLRGIYTLPIIYAKIATKGSDKIEQLMQNINDADLQTGSRVEYNHCEYKHKSDRETVSVNTNGFNDLIEVVIQTGGVERAMGLANKYSKRASKLMDNFKDSANKKAITVLINKLMQRSS